MRPLQAPWHGTQGQKRLQAQVVNRVGRTPEGANGALQQAACTGSTASALRTLLVTLTRLHLQGLRGAEVSKTGTRAGRACHRPESSVCHKGAAPRACVRHRPQRCVQPERVVLTADTSSAPKGRSLSRSLLWLSLPAPHGRTAHGSFACLRPCRPPEGQAAPRPRGGRTGRLSTPTPVPRPPRPLA